MLFIAFISIQILRIIESARIIRETEKAKYLAEHELEIGHQIQSGFFPESLPDPAGWEIAAHFKPARQVAGDFYDVFPLQDGKRVGFVIADICDKGVGAALFMALIRSLIRAILMQNINTYIGKDDPVGFEIYSSLEKTINFTNNYLAQTHGQSNMFATVFIGVIDLKSGKLYYINCGHEPPVIINGSCNTIFLKPTGAAIGVIPDLDYIHKQLQINSGDVFFAYTDGVTDAQNHTGEFFSKEQLLSVLKNGITSADDLVTIISEKVYDHISQTEQFDDITMIAIKRMN